MKWKEASGRELKRKFFRTKQAIDRQERCVQLGLGLGLGLGLALGLHTARQINCTRSMCTNSAHAH